MIDLYNADCFNIIKNIPDHSINLILTDLPFGVTKMEWDKPLDMNKFWTECERILAPKGNVVLFSSGMFTIDLINSNRKNFKYRLIWKKNVPTGMSSAKYRPMKYYEEICVFNYDKATYNPQMKPRVGVGKACYNYDHYCGESNHVEYKKIKKRYDPNLVQPSDILEFNVVPNRKGKLHPTQKPVELLGWLIKSYSNESDKVLDCCMGSGSVGVACKNTNRHFVGVEMNEKYFNIAKDRIEGIEIENE